MLITNIKNTIYKLLVMFTLMLPMLLSGCKHHEPDMPTPYPEQARRTVLVYMVAANSLGAPGKYGEYDLQDIEEMKEGMASMASDARLLLYHLPYSGDPKLMEISAKGIDTLKVYDNLTLSVSGARMAQVIDDAAELAPADDMGIVLWSHASGWLQNGIEDNYIPGQKILKSFGEQGANKMNITTLASVLRGRDLSFVYFDCCNMAGAEVAYELRDAARRMVGSVIALPGPGTNYRDALKCLFAYGEADLEGAVRATYDVYVRGEEYPEYDYCAMSVIDLTKMDALAAAVRDFYSDFGIGMPDRTPQRYSSSAYYYDLLDYCEALAEGSGSLSQQELDKVRAAIADAVPYAVAMPKYNSIPIEKHCGLSTYILQTPSNFKNRGYSDLQWANDVASALLND